MILFDTADAHCRFRMEQLLGGDVRFWLRDGNDRNALIVLPEDELSKLYDALGYVLGKHSEKPIVVVQHDPEPKKTKLASHPAEVFGAFTAARVRQLLKENPERQILVRGTWPTSYESGMVRAEVSTRVKSAGRKWVKIEVNGKDVEVQLETAKDLFVMVDGKTIVEDGEEV